MSTMQISQLAERSGVPATTLRFYEGAGLLPAERSPSGYRLYGEDSVERLAFIGAAKHLGLPLDEVGELLTVWESGACAEVKVALRPRLAKRLDEAEARAEEAVRFAGTLRGALGHLDALPDRPGRCDPGCDLLAAPPEAEDDTAGSDTAGSDTAGSERWRDVPVACSLDAGGMAERIDRWRRLTDGAGRQAIEGGLRLTLPVERAGDVATLAAAEQACCPFFDFRLHLDGHELHLEVRAPADAAVMLADLFAEPEVAGDNRGRERSRGGGRRHGAFAESSVRAGAGLDGQHR